MIWTKPEYTRTEVDRAGEALINGATQEEKSNALKVLDNWRASHSYPLHVFKIRLKRAASNVDEEALVVQRLKRVPTILKKLKRRYEGRPATMKLSQMQDIGGCRAVLSNVQQARQLCKKYYSKGGDLRHKQIRIRDYIEEPKEDGYRSIHIIYKFMSEKESKKEYNGLLIEIQIRSKLQHLWATAIETVDFFTKQAIKSNEGRAEWAEFFRLVSSAFAGMEKCPQVSNTPTDEKTLYLNIKETEKKLNVIKMMKGWTKAMKVFEDEMKTAPKLKYFLLELDIVNERLIITSYTKDYEHKAVEDYAKAEKKNEGREYDVVLVGADASTDLKKAYQNYFADTDEFLEKLKKIIEKY